MTRRVSHPLLILLAFAGLWLALTVGIRFTTHSFTLGHDYITFWHASRYMLFEHGNPYSPELTTRSQLAILGRAAQPGEDQKAFSYPPFSLIPVLPFSPLPYEWSQAGWMAANLILWIAAAVYLRLRPVQVATIVFFFPLTFGMLLGNLAPLVGLSILWGIWLAFFKPGGSGPASEWIAGGLIAWSTIKPQLSWMFILFFAACALRQRRWRLLAAFLACSIFFAALSFLWTPTWLSDWLARIGEYQGYVTIGITLTTLLERLAPRALALALTLAAAVGLIGVAGWLYGQWARQRRPLALLFAWTGLGAFLFHPHGLAYEQVAMLVPFFVWCASDGAPRRATLVLWASALVFSWLAYALSFADSLWDFSPLFLYAAWFAWLLHTNAPQNQPPPAAPV